MPAQIDDRLIIAISSRALFDLSESHAVYEAAGVEAYQQHQVEHENELLTPGVAFDLVRGRQQADLGDDSGDRSDRDGSVGRRVGVLGRQPRSRRVADRGGRRDLPGFARG